MEEKSPEKLLQFTGLEVNYYFICPKKLWWFHHGIQMETESDRVKMGRVVHENAYGRKRKEISIDERIVLDWRESGVVHEVKLTDKMERAHEFQLLYYLFYLKQKGIENLKGQIDYPKLKQTREVELTGETEAELIEALKAMKEIVEAERAPEVPFMPICKSCSYAELCWS